MSDTCTFTPPTPVLTAATVNILFDSTAGLTNTPSASAAGPLRGMFNNTRISGMVECLTQDTTLRLDYLDSAGSWTAGTGAKSSTVTAGTPAPFDWLAVTGEWRLVLVCGGTGPSAIKYDGITLVRGDRASGS